MVAERSHIRRLIFAVLLVLFAVAAALAAYTGGIPVGSQSPVAPETDTLQAVTLVPANNEADGLWNLPVAEDLSALGRYKRSDYSSVLRFCGAPLPVDTASDTVYLAQPETNTGTLTAEWEGLSLYITVDGSTLLVANEAAGTYMSYQIVTTALPVIRLEGGFSYFDKDGENAYTGTVHLFTPYDTEEGAYTVKASRTGWHLRGATTSRQPKRSWKLDLMDDKRQNNELSFLGLGADDDWILNGMSLDDTRMKEKLAMDLWNELAADTPHNAPMSTGEYVELVINGEYMGVFLLQRRIDANYLALSEEDILLKGLNTWAAASPADGYEIEHSPLSNRDTYALMEGWSNMTDCSMTDKENFIDVQLFLQWGSMKDNTSYNNMYYLLRPNGSGGYSMTMTPWDTDYSMGVLWDDDFFAYRYEMSMESIPSRVEYEAMEALYPALREETARRWFALRESVYSQQYLQEKLNGYSDYLDEALARDRAKWGAFYGGEDSFDRLCKFNEQRLERLDAYYAPYLN